MVSVWLVVFMAVWSVLAFCVGLVFGARLMYAKQHKTEPNLSIPLFMNPEGWDRRTQKEVDNLPQNFYS